ncbi:hypothetical protein [Photorhabdus namnaonensis]|uniref:Uncharacterized protein n=1 Tax=Photorhabdus namnaonensis TaxID=1851568 RepID=A0A1B8YHB7_9GAMM|nr:hypothetical protein Phpb_02425 [Photorhabdus namnaonensis]
MNLKNDFKAFSIGNNANVPSQINYEASENINNGFQADKAITTHDLNKALRQSSTIASVVADFIKTQSGENVLDDGDIAKITVQLNRALEKTNSVFILFLCLRMKSSQRKTATMKY